MKLFQIQIQVTEKTENGEVMNQVPTFFLENNGNTFKQIERIVTGKMFVTGEVHGCIMDCTSTETHMF